uniref:Uncharacterized protein n=1 Tax=Avena sativa TaxID=4498 RepID=A0ACD5TYV2_AVESA
MAGLPCKLVGLLLPLGFLVFAVCVMPEFFIHLTNRWAWRLALATSFGQVHYLLSLRLSAASVVALFALLVALEHWIDLFDVAPFARWLDRLETQFWEYEGFDDDHQVLALYAVEAFLMVVIFDLGLACILGFLPFSLGRVIIWCISSDFRYGDEVKADTSRVSIFLMGYGFIISAAVISAMLNTFGQYLRGKRLTVAIFIRRLPGIFLAGIIGFIDFANFCLAGLNATLYPLLFGWWLDIWSSKMVGATMSQRFKLLSASPFASMALQWLLGHTFSYLYTRLFILHHKILRPGVAIPSDYHIDEPFYKLYLKKRILIGFTFVPGVIFVSIHIADRLAPELFPLDNTYFVSFWQAPRNYADSICRVFLLRFLMSETDMLVYVEWLVKKVIRYYSFATSVVLAWMTAVTFGSAVLIFPISIGRALLFAITRLPLACGLKSNDLLAFVVGFSIISTIIAASRDSFAYMTRGRAGLVALNRHVVKFLWVVIVPLLMGSLVDLLLIPLLAGPDDDVSVFYIWYMGFVLMRVWLYLVHSTRDTPFLAYFIDERWSPKIARFKQDYLSGAISPCRFFKDIFMPMATKLLAALGVPYVLAKGIFPRFGYSDAVNSAVCRFAWLGILGTCALCYIVKVLCVELHHSIRDDRYLIGKKVEDCHQQM